MSLYQPKHFSDPSWRERVVDGFPLATVVTCLKEELYVSHLPLLRERGELIGHLARANSHRQALEQAPTTAIFRGPDSYISPTWYDECDVPTWNYVVVHATGRARLLEGEELVAALRQLSERQEGAGGWRFEVPEDLRGTGVLDRAIVGFALSVERWEVKAKLSQNRSPEDRAGVIEGLLKGSPRSQELAEWMRR